MPSSKAGEMFLTPYFFGQPEDESLPVSYGLPPTAASGQLGVVDAGDGFIPLDPAAPRQFIKSGFYGAAANANVISTNGQVPALCTVDGAGVSNCLESIVIDVEQGFRLNVLIYDQNGAFVNQYTQTVTNAEIWEVQKRSFGSVDLGRVSPTAGDPRVRVNVQIYPRSQENRLIGNGVYIMYVDLLRLQREPKNDPFCTVTPFDDRCVPLYKQSPEGEQLYDERPTNRVTFIRRMPYMRPSEF